MPSESAASVPANPVNLPSPALPAPTEAPRDPRLSKIKTLAFGQSKLLSSCLDPVSGWRFENGEVRFIFSKNDSWVVDLLSAREQHEKLQSLCAEVLGQPVRICVTLDNEERSGLKNHRSARERAESDGGVEALVKKFRCTLVDVTDLSRE